MFLIFRYLKYLTKKYLKKNNLRDWLRVVANSKTSYELRYFNVSSLCALLTGLYFNHLIFSYRSTMKKRTRRMTRNKLSLTFLFVWRDAVINSDHEAIFLERFIFSPNVFNVNIAIVFFFSILKILFLERYPFFFSIFKKLRSRNELVLFTRKVAPANFY